jgi:hypothetical protein
LKLQLIYLEEGAVLFAGYGSNFPILQWGGTGWQTYKPAEPEFEERMVRLSEREAERCFPGATTAARPDGVPDWEEFSAEVAMRLRSDLFDSYDTPYIRKSPDEQREERAAAIARVKSLLAGEESPDETA